jgi:hypothetical protein
MVSNPVRADRRGVEGRDEREERERERTRERVE